MQTETSQAGQRQEPSLYQGGLLVLLTLGLALANLMEVLDTTIANVSLPSITGDLGAATNQGAWIITSYAVANAIIVPLTGWLSQRFGQVRIFMSAILVFTLASWLCGMATSLEMLILFRIIQGASGGLMIPLSQTLLMSAYPPEKRGMALAIWGMTVMVAPIIGPLLGGWLTDNYAWSWIFYVNLPVGVFSLLVTWRLLGHRDTPTQRKPIDLVGLTLLVVWVGSLQILLDKGNELDWFHSGFIVALALTSLVGFVVFVIWELAEENPIVDIRIFRYRNFRNGVLALSLGFGLYFASVFLIPQWLQTQMGYTSSWAGLVAAPGGIFAILLMPFVGAGLRKIDPRVFASIAFVIFAGASFWRSEFTTQVDYVGLILPQLLQGVGVALFFAPLISINMGGISPQEAASASGLQNFVRTMAGSFGASLIITFWERREALHRTNLVEHLNAYSDTLDHALAQFQGVGLSAQQAVAQVDRLLTGQAYMLATNDLFWISGVLFLSLIAFVWMTRPPFSAAQGGGH